MTAFAPTVNQTLTLFGDEFTFQPLPMAHMYLASFEGSRATVYQLKSADGGLHALKVFKKAYRTDRIDESAQRLTTLEQLPGMRAARRRMVPSTEPAVQQYPELEHALLMPWIQGDTWYDVLLRAEKGQPLPLGSAVHLCERFLYVVKELEAMGITHTDISQANVVLNFGLRDVQLIDLEEIYQAGVHLQPRAGAAGYAHAARESVCCPEGDRYAAAVLAAEMLVLANEQLAVTVSDTGFFETHAADYRGAAKYTLAEPWLKQAAPTFSETFAAAWHAPRLAECPTVEELHRAIAEVAAQTSIDAPPYSQPRPPRSQPRQPSTKKVIGWKPILPAGVQQPSHPTAEPAPPTGAVVAPQKPARTVKPPPSKHVKWLGPGEQAQTGAAPQTSVTGGQGSKKPTATQSDNTVAFWIVIVLVALVLLALWLANGLG